jgi:hypothetical protein
MMGKICVSGRGLFRTIEIIYLEKLNTMNFDSRIYCTFPITVGCMLFLKSW